MFSRVGCSCLCLWHGKNLHTEMWSSRHKYGILLSCTLVNFKIKKPIIAQSARSFMANNGFFSSVFLLVNLRTTHAIALCWYVQLGFASCFAMGHINFVVSKRSINADSMRLVGDMKLNRFVYLSMEWNSFGTLHNRFQFSRSCHEKKPIGKRQFAHLFQFFYNFFLAFGILTFREREGKKPVYLALEIKSIRLLQNL